MRSHPSDVAVLAGGTQTTRSSPSGAAMGGWGRHASLLSATALRRCGGGPVSVTVRVTGKIILYSKMLRKTESINIDVHRRSLDSFV